MLFDYSRGTTLLDNEVVVMTKELLAGGAQYVRQPMELLGFKGEEAGYLIVFSFCAVAYLIGWSVMKILVPKYKQIKID